MCDPAAKNAALFFVADPSPELQKVRDAIEAYRSLEACASRDLIIKAETIVETAMDAAIDAFLQRTPKDGSDILEMIEVVARDNCWNTTHAEDVPAYFETFVASLKKFAQVEDGGEYNPAALDFNTIDPEPMLSAIDKACGPESSARNGERFAIGILGKSKEQLLATLRDIPDEPGEALVDSVCCALQCLEDRVRLVKSAFARLSVCADILGAEQAPEQLPVEG
jgi:hypothetical protein